MDVFGLQWAENPQISPDGRSMVYQRYAFDVMKDRKRSSVWIVDADGHGQRPLSNDAGSQSDPAWSVDGKRLAWIAGGDGGKSQIVVRWMDSGQSARITELTESPHNLAWSPDGRSIAFTMRVPGEDEPLAKLPLGTQGRGMGSAGQAHRSGDISHRRRRLCRSGLHACIRGVQRWRRGAADHERQA